ncbi:NADH dehydrogenase [ubiquinone] 1 alpha subcomplex subunit [Sesamum angolense]|uniref:NADH dehydrogenase [ubiquinone] 1 alpha subcomplex subunit n=1 Tax=Sesamum angolense TaxID=2727404 RepID=A0AAE1X6Y0_9LAMI|nr:NADH dehydrogenase [ubiquinone] 1 alpha subcomplex subunit [Sesamum angolense]
MASSLKYVRVPPNSASLAEARQRVFEFFKTACRSIPSIMEIYTLHDVVAPPSSAPPSPPRSGRMLTLLTLSLVAKLVGKAALWRGHLNLGYLLWCCFRPIFLVMALGIRKNWLEATQLLLVRFYPRLAYLNIWVKESEVPPLLLYIFWKMLYVVIFGTEVIDMLLFKGTEELSNIVEHAKQRHHIIGQYVVGRQGLDVGTKDQACPIS